MGAGTVLAGNLPYSSVDAEGPERGDHDVRQLHKTALDLLARPRIGDRPGEGQRRLVKPGGAPSRKTLDGGEALGPGLPHSLRIAGRDGIATAERNDSIGPVEPEALRLDGPGDLLQRRPRHRRVEGGAPGMGIAQQSDATSLHRGSIRRLLCRSAC